MAAKTTIEQGLDYLLSAGGTTIGGGVDATLRQSQSVVPVTNKGSANLQANKRSVRTWGADFTNLYLESSEEITGEDVSITVAGTALKGITSATLTINCAIEEIVNSTTGLDREILPLERSATLSIDADWYDPAGTGATALDATLDEVEGSTSAGLALVVTFGTNGSISFTGRPTDVPTSFPSQGKNTVSLTFESDGAITDGSTNEDTGFGALMDAILASDAATSVSLALASTNTGSTEYSGTAYITQIQFTIPIDDRVEVSGTAEGSGAITRGATV